MRSWLKSKVRNRAIVYTLDDHIYEGWLMEAAGDGVVLTDTRAQHDGGIELAGDVFVPRTNVRLIQIVRSSRRA